MKKKCVKCELNYTDNEDCVCNLCKGTPSKLTRPEVLRVGDVFGFNTNAELINFLTDSNIKEWLQATYNLPGKNAYIWLLRLDGINRSGWVDTINNGVIKQRYVGSLTDLPSNYDKFKDKEKWVFEKFGGGFRFLGVYVCDTERTTKSTERYFIKIKDHVTISSL